MTNSDLAPLNIHCDFDGGNILVEDASNSNDVCLSIRKDIAADFFQWFYFAVDGAASKVCNYRLSNASSASYAEAWDGYDVVASYDRETWFRVPTEYKDGQLSWSHNSDQDRVYYSYFAPYDKARHAALLAKIEASENCQLIKQIDTVDGHTVELFKLSNGSDAANKRKLWVIARQHPGESMAEWFMEGMLERLLSASDAESQSVLDAADLYFVVNMNPDGSWAGNLRTNGAGTDLNRAWQSPSVEASPEVLGVRNSMDEIGVDLFLDIHGDEELPYVFTAGAEGNPAYTPKIEALECFFRQRYEEINPDFQSKVGYDKDEPGKADLRIACNQVGERFDCLAYTIEMPFKDNANFPDKKEGWSPARSMKLGDSTVQLLAELCPKLR